MTSYVQAYDTIILLDGSALTDEDGTELTFDLNSKLTTDLSQLDVSTPGLYPVEFEVQDYAGNGAMLEIWVEILVPEGY